MRKGFTLIELLVVIAIIAILAVVVVLTLNPAELLRQSRDANRISDMATLNSALGLYNTDQSGASSYGLGSASSVYVSMYDGSSTCSNLSLLPAPYGSNYACSPSSTYRNISSSGWIPVNFQNISAGTPISALPVDPTNQTSSGLYYSYATNGTQYEITASMESQKYQESGSNDVVSTDGGANFDLLEKGTNLALEPLDYGHNQNLVGYWPLNEGTSTIAYDFSGSGNKGTWSGTPTGTSGYYSKGNNQAWAGAFDGSTDYVSIGTSSLPSGVSPSSGFAWIYLTATSTTHGIIDYGTRGIAGQEQDLYYQLSSGYLSFYNGATTYNAGGASVSLNAWHYVGWTYGGGTTLTLYLDGVAYPQTILQQNVTLGASAFIGRSVAGEYFHGLIDDVRIYNRPLSATEIQALYNAGR